MANKQISQISTEIKTAGKVRAMNLRASHKIPRPLKTIRDKCSECVCGSEPEIRKCHMGDCPLFPYRFGRSPKPEDLKVPIQDHYGNTIREEDYKGYMVK